MTDKGYDPRLRDAVNEIRAVLDKYEVGGAFALSSTTHHEYYNHIAKWCGIQFKDSGRIHIKLNSKTPEHTESSVAHILGTRDVLMMLAKHHIDLAEVVTQLLKANGVEFDHTPVYAQEPNTEGLS